MFRLAIKDPDYRLVLPRSRRYYAVIGTAYRLIKQERGLPEEEQLPYLDMLEKMYQTALQSLNNICDYEGKRRRCTLELELMEREVRGFYKRLEAYLSVYYGGNPKALLAWGFTVAYNKQYPRGKVIPPHRRADLRQFFKDYVEEEKRKPEAERLTFVALDEVRAVRDKIEEQYRQREYCAKRAVSERAHLRNDISKELLDLIRLSVAHLVLVRFNGRLSPELEAWGLQIQKRVKWEDIMSRRAARLANEESAVEEAEVA